MSEILRLKFSRKGPVKYLGHLDNLRYFQKAILRSNIDIKYSEGFNPHQLISFAYPLGVSMETEGDYFDIEVNSYSSTEDVVKALNNVMNEGFTIKEASVVSKDEVNCMAAVAMADYTVSTDYDFEADEISAFLANEHIFIEKENKKQIKKKVKKKNSLREPKSNDNDNSETMIVDIKPGIISLCAEQNLLKMSLISGSETNIKPAQVVDAISQSLHKNIMLTNIVRNEIYKVSNGKYIPLGQK